MKELNNWVVRYYSSENPKKQYNFAGFKEDGNPSYAFKYDNILKFKTVHEAFEVAKKLMDTGKYISTINRIHHALNDEYYFTGNLL